MTVKICKYCGKKFRKGDTVRIISGEDINKEYCNICPSLRLLQELGAKDDI